MEEITCIESNKIEKELNTNKQSCTLCKYQCLLKRTMQSHIKSKHQNTSINEKLHENETEKNKKHQNVCPECCFVAASKKALKLHTTVKHEKSHKKKIKSVELQNHHKCPFCQITMPDELALIKHVLALHQANLKEYETVTDVDICDGEFKCQFCGFNSTEESKLTEHINIIHKRIKSECLNETYNCPFCERNATNIRSLRNHISLKHRQESKASKQMICPQCNFKGTKRAMQLHTKKEHKDVNLPEQFKCSYCTYIARKKRTLINHISLKHKEERRLALVSAGKEFLCSYCDYRCFNKYGLKTHINKKHRPLYTDIGRTFYCDKNKCDFTCNTKDTLNSHCVNIHAKILSNSCLEENCDFYGKRKHELRNHLQSVHGMQMEMHDLQFNTHKDFQAWLNSVESKTCARFVVTKVLSKNDTTDKMYYDCNRSGLFISKGQGKRKELKKGSRKMGATCTAGINYMKTSDGTINANACLTHYGHDMALEHLWLTQTEKTYLQEKIMSGENFDQILNHIRENLVTNANVSMQRLHLVQRRDLHNLKRSIVPNTTAVNEQQFAKSKKKDVATISRLLQDAHSDRIEKKLDYLKEHVRNISKDNLIEIDKKLSLLDKFFILPKQIETDSDKLHMACEHNVTLISTSQHFNEKDFEDPKRQYIDHRGNDCNLQKTYEDSGEVINDMIVWEMDL